MYKYIQERWGLLEVVWYKLETVPGDRLYYSGMSHFSLQICSNISEKCALSVFRVVTSNLLHLSSLNILIELLFIINFLVHSHSVHIYLLILQSEWLLPIFERIQTFTSKRTNHDRIVFIPIEVLAGSVTWRHWSDQKDVDSWSRRKDCSW